MARVKFAFQRSVVTFLGQACCLFFGCSTTESEFDSIGSDITGIGGTGATEFGGGSSGIGAGSPGININVGGSVSSGTATTAVWPPVQCASTPLEGSLGAYCLGPLVRKADATPANDNANVAVGCGTTLWGVVRDFVTYRADIAVTSPDFGSYCCNVVKGMVASELGVDNKPVYTGVGATAKMMTDQAHFEQWYNDVTDINEPYYVAFRLDNDGSGTYTFSAADSTHQYFPLDGAGWGNDSNNARNFSFTTEIHTQFVYNGGEVFTFTGDDDLWVFINRKLAIDIGGVHMATTESINLDDRKTELLLEVGGVYQLDLFGAERHAGDSNFRIDTSMTFVDCGVQPPVIQ